MAWVGLQHSAAASRVVVVTSSLPEEGKSLTSLSLARVVAALGHTVAVVDADLRRASLAAKAGVEPKITITDVIERRWPMQDAMVRDPRSPVDLLVGGPGGHKDVNLLAAGDRLAEMFAELRGRYELVIVDGPPALAVADIHVLMRLADQTVFCVRWDQTPRDAILSAIRTLRDSRAKVAGTLLTRVNVRKHSQYGYHDSGYYYGRYSNYYSN
jgi:Mrp family chromosome partitioning ATPase